jgi:hypothetical protein
MKRSNAVMVRLDDAQVRELDALASALAHAAVLGMLRGYCRHGRMTLPVEMIPALDVAPLDNPALNEPPARRGSAGRR